MARRDPAPTDAGWLIAGVAVLAAALGLWGGGVAIAWLWFRHDTHVPPTSAVLLLFRTLAQPAHPARAWPRGAELPPAPLLGAAECTGAAGAVLAPVLAWRHLANRLAEPRQRRPLARRRRHLLPSVPPPPAARWAGRRDLDLLRVPQPTAGRLTLGWSGRHLLAAERRASLVVLGPSQSGKTTGLAIPAILEWQGPVVATSVKADLVRDTIDARSARDATWVFDPTGATGRPAAGWSPLAASGGWQGARRTAAWLCSAARTGAGTGGGDEDFWYAAAGKLLAPYLLAAAAGGRDLAQVVRWIDRQEESEVGYILETARELDALDAARASWQRDDRTRSSIFTTAEIVLEAYADPLILRSAATSEIQPSVLLGGGMPTLYVCAPGHEQERLRPVFATLLQTVITAAYDTALWRGGTLDPPLLLVLDEAANIAPLRDLDAIASTAAGHGIQLVTVWQDLAQVRARYGERASTVVSNHRGKLMLSGVSDPATLEYASRLIGDGEVADHSFTIDPNGARSMTRSRRERKLAPDAELRRIRPGEGVLVYGHLPPARLRLRPWFEPRRRRLTRGSSGVPTV